MKSISGVEAMLAVALAATLIAIFDIAAKATKAAHAAEQPKKASFERNWKLAESEAALARARENASRAFTKFADLRLELLHREAEHSAGIASAATVNAVRAEVRAVLAYVGKADATVHAIEGDLAARRKASDAAFRKANEDFDRKLQLETVAWRAGAVVVLLSFAFVILSLRFVRNTLEAMRRVVFGATLLLTASAFFYQWGGISAVVAACGVVVLIAIFFIARVTPPPTEPRP